MHSRWRLRSFGPAGVALWTHLTASWVLLEASLKPHIRRTEILSAPGSLSSFTFSMDMGYHQLQSERRPGAMAPPADLSLPSPGGSWIPGVLVCVPAVLLSSQLPTCSQGYQWRKARVLGTLNSHGRRKGRPWLLSSDQFSLALAVAAICGVN